MKYSTFWSILTICSTGIFTNAEGNFQRRQKRIVAGEVIDIHNRFYTVTNWYAWIGQDHSCIIDANSAWANHCAKPQNLKCGGSLLTPNIIQTSCSCIASFVGPQQGNITKACILNTWEKMTLIFLAARDVPNLVDGYMSDKMVIHEKCGKLVTGPTTITTHDYGLIKLRKIVKQTGRDIGITFAPIYSMKTLGRLYTYALNAGVVCMITGYGPWELTTDLVTPKVEKSTSMRHAWMVVYDYLKCYYLTRVIDTNGTYLDQATWMCMTALPEAADRVTKPFLTSGDQGGPLACNNQYLGVLSDDLHRIGQGLTLQLANSVAFTPYENAIEFRQEFEMNLQTILNDPTFRPTFITVFPLADKGYITSKTPAQLGQHVKFLLFATACSTMKIFLI